ALEKWPVAWFELLLPRHLQIIYEINRRLLEEVRNRFPSDEGRVQRVSLIEEGTHRQVRMAHLAIVGSHSTRGLGANHSAVLKTQTVPGFAELMPERFNNKTSGVSQRRFLLVANPALARLISRAIGSGWITDFHEFKKLRSLADDAGFQTAFLEAKREAKVRLVDWLRRSTGITVDPETVFDTQTERIHECNRQLLNALRIAISYHRLRQNPNLDEPPRTFFFSGKAAPAYRVAKIIIKLINNLATTIDKDPDVGGRLKVVFIPDYRVSVAERLIPASDVSNQISTAGCKATGTSQVKFMMNGALTVGVRDRITLEAAKAAGEDNFFLFGLTAEQVTRSRAWYSPRWHYDHDPEIRTALDLIASDHFSRREPGVFAPILDVLLRGGDYYMHLADLASYIEAQRRAGEMYPNRPAWARKALLNIANAGWFSSDRAVLDYAADVWNVRACPPE
ncbi:MAG: glycogen/starch/alpha-glucan phosphorylase, partial [Verrucomicrobia bacterium]|nr:glycogen/starch/alpha-glucan phosphorylase [Verrucomicrobiota bacterium]